MCYNKLSMLCPELHKTFICIQTLNEAATSPWEVMARKNSPLPRLRTWESVIQSQVLSVPMP